MRKRFMQLAAVLLAIILCVPVSWAATTNDDGEIMIRVGLASTSSHVAQGTMEAAHLENNTGYGSGYRFGYYDDDLNFVELGRTDEDITQIAVLKTQNLYYGYVPSLGKTTYSSQITSDIAVGCYHIQIPGSYAVYRDAAADAQVYGGFVAWVNGAYQVRVGSYLTKADAQAALDSMTQGTIVGTSSYGINVVETGTDNILFQYDNSSSPIFAVLPDVTGEDDVRTWFLGFKYRGGFTYQRIDGGNLTVANVLDLENYVKGVACYEMGRSWPLEALKAQSICARTYALVNLGTHNSLGFDVCNTDYCQVYHGAGSNRTDYGPSEISDQAVEETAGMVLWYEDTLAETYYSSSHGGASEEVANVWGSNDPGDYPYLCGVIDPYESTIADLNPYSSWTVSYTASSLASRLQGYGYGVNTSIDHLELTYSELGNVLKIVVHWKNGSTNTFRSTGSGSAKTDIRTTFGLRSIRFTVNGQTVTEGGGSPSSGDGYPVNGSGSVSGTDGLYVISGSGTVSQAGDDLYTISGSGSVSALEPDSGSSGGSNEGGGTVTVSGSSYVFDGAGWGHQIGLSQYGANAMARLGYTGEEIVEFYFPGTRVEPYDS